jgi:hypothetical protein
MDEALREKIQKRAHEIFLKRGHQAGTPEGDWVAAEKEILKETKVARPAAKKIVKPQKK